MFSTSRLRNSRRRFLQSAGLLTLGAALPRLLVAYTGGPSRLVVVILRGALDGLAAMPPYADSDYFEMHRELAIAAPGSADGALILDGTFGLHPSLAFLHERFAAGELIAFQAVASPYRDRSHFDGQCVLENGMGKPIGSADGWLNRALTQLPGLARPDRAAAISQNLPLILRGTAPVLSKSPQNLPDVDDDLLARLGELYSTDDWFAARLSQALQAQKTTPLAGTPPDVSPQAQTGADRVSSVTRMAASLMRSENGPQIAVIEANGWDTHANQGGANGLLAQRLRGLDRALRALAVDLGPVWQQCAVLVITEFGRTAAMNGTRGTDHGTGGCAFLAGGAVRGGRVVADWPGLSRSALLENRDLRPTLDLRSIFKGVLAEHLRIDAKALARTVFPDSAGARPLQGLMRAA